MKNMRITRIVAMVLAALLLLSMPALATATPKAVKATSIAFEYTAKTIMPGERIQLKPIIEPIDATSAITWTSSNRSVAVVSKHGKVRAIKSGTTKITAKIGKLKAVLNLSVRKSLKGTDVHVYAIGNGAYINNINPLKGPPHDVAALTGLYYSGAFGGNRPNVYPKTNLTGAQMHSFMNEIVHNPDIKERDITIFYYSGHGAGRTGSIENYGALIGIDGQPLRVQEVQGYLDQIKGNVIILLDSCYSGQMIAQKGVMTSKGVTEADLTALNNIWVNTFAKSKAQNYDSKAISNSIYHTKYHVMTAASSHQLSYDIPLMDGTNQGLFTAAMCQVFDPDMAKYYDKNKDKIITFKEAYSAINAIVKNELKYMRLTAAERKTAQVTTVWPDKKSPFPLYANKY